jgi:putative ABC transport system permease protein
MGGVPWGWQWEKNMTEIIKNMFRRKTRTMLTIFGITIGIFAFVVMGSMAEKINLLVNGGTQYYSDKVTVAESTGGMVMPLPMNITKADEIARVKGVAAVSATVYTAIEELGAVSFGPPPAIVGSDFKDEGYESFVITYSSGRALRAGEDGKVVVGADLVKKLDAKVGGTVSLKDREYEVVGIMAKTLTAPDTSVMMTLRDAQQILYESLPEVIKGRTNPEQLVNGFTVFPRDKGQDLEALAERINREVGGVKATGPKAFEEQIASATGIFNAILFGVALISLLVGGLSIINTMTMAISERIREIGIKKAVGAKTRSIMAEYLTEAGLIGLLGGLVGWALGAGMVWAVNAAMADSGNQIFLLSWRISLFAIGFAVVLGVLAGLYPAWYAVRVNIVKALREG